MAKIIQSFICCLVYTLASDVTCVVPLKYNLVAGLPGIYLTPMSEKIGHTWENGNVWDKPLIQLFYSLLSKDECVILDIGAQTGSFSLLAKFVPHSRWYSFEPIKEAVDTLKENLSLNDIHNVSVYQMAVADFNGKASLKMPAMNAWGLATIGSDVLRFIPVATREVECITLDRFVEDNGIKKVDFIKIDTEGAELFILRGAQNIIMRDRPTILMEYNETNMKQCGVTKEDINALLTHMGYQWQLVSTEDILCIPIS